MSNPYQDPVRKCPRIRQRLLQLVILLLMCLWPTSLLVAQEGAQERPSPEAVIGIIVIIILVGLVISLVIMGVISALLYMCFNRVPPQHREMEPWKVFLLMIPCFNLVWNFMVYPALSRSYQSYFKSIGRTDVDDCGEKIGWWYAIAVACSIIPVIQYLAGPASLVLLIIYLVKAFQLRGQIPEAAVGMA